VRNTLRPVWWFVLPWVFMLCFEGVPARPYISGRTGLHESDSDTSLGIVLEYNSSSFLLYRLVLLRMQVEYNINKV
jgi:hypothetical protein